MGSWIAFARAHAGAWAVSMLMVTALPGIAAASDARTILILSPEDSLRPFGHVTTDTVVAKLNDSISADLTIRTEFMESSQTPDGPDEDVIASRLAAKYSGEKIDLVFATGPQALSLFVHKKEILFPGTPIFLGIRNGNPMLQEIAENWGAVTTDYNVVSTVKLAQALQPGLKRLVLVTGGAAFDRTWHGRAHQDVLLNLVRNACYAMSASENRQLTFTTDGALEDGAGILVADTGKGVSLELQDKVLEPFITSKTQGLGLGPAISRTILKAHGGSIWCKQNPGGGAIFAFSLPAAERRIAWAS
jgi:hypothetical protein